MLTQVSSQALLQSEPPDSLIVEECWIVQISKLGSAVAK